MVLMAGIAILAASNNIWVLAIGVLFMACSTLFAFITLPVEFDASNRAMAWIRESGHASQLDNDGAKNAKNALFWAAMTYVVGALAALGQLVFYASKLLNRR